MNAPIYLDYAASTPVAPDVLAVMLPYFTTLAANPHASTHRAGRTAHAGVELARAQVARALGVADAEIIFTSGATEANNLALRGVLRAAPRARRRLVSVETEHSCVLETAADLAAQGFPVTVLPVLPNGLLDLDVLAAALGPDVALVSVMAVNNETGVIQPMARIAELVRSCGALMHCDAAQGFGKIPLDPADFDLASLSAHKIYGPIGVGALAVRSGVTLHPHMTGGGQEAGVRSGTLSPALCAGFGAAAARAVDRTAQMQALQAAALDALAGLAAGSHVHGETAPRYAGILNFQLAGVDAARLMSDARGIMLSSGAACAARAGRASHVLAAMGVSDAGRRQSLRMSFGETTSLEDVSLAMARLGDALALQCRA